MQGVIDEDFSGMMNTLSRFSKLFEIARIVDPLHKKVVFTKDKTEEDFKIKPTCYKFWQRDTQCANCVSMRASREKDTFVKIEFNNHKIFMVMGSPVNIKGKNYVLELLKDITETGIIYDLKGKSVSDINRIISEMNQEVILDELTKIYNRRYINERLPVDIYNHHIEQKPLSIIMIDIDDFKHVNDSYGHGMGDFILTEFAKVLSSCIRKDFDWVARYGGEEFIAALLNSNGDVAFKVAEKMRRAIENKDFFYNDYNIQITASFGIYTLGSEEITMEDVLDMVDKKLYKAKDSGKNTIIQ